MKALTPLAVAVALALGMAPLAGQTVWTGSGNGNWSSSGNWSGGVPANATSTTVTFNASSVSPSTVDTSYSIGSLTVQSGTPALTLNGTGGAVLTFSAGLSDASANALVIGSGLGLAGTQGNGTTGLGITGGGTVTINSTTSTYTGDTVISSGTLSDGAANAYSAGSLIYLGASGVLNVNNVETVAGLSDSSGSGGTVTLASGARLVMSGGYSSTFSGVIQGQGGIEKNTVGTLTLTGANTYTGSTSIGSGAAIQIGSGGTTGSLQSSGVSGAGSLGFNLSSAYTYSGILSGSLSVVKQGSGTVTLGGVNTYTGATTVNAGTLKAGGTSPFGGTASTDIVTINGSGVLDISTYNVTVGSVSSASSSSSITLGSGSLSLAATWSSESFAGVISGAGSLASSAYQISLNNANTYTGGTSVEGGTLVVQNASGSGIGTGTLFIQSGAGFQIGNGSTGGFIDSGIAITNNGSLVVSKTSSLTLANAISGTGTLDKYHSGGLILSGSNTYSGVTTINAGSLADGAANAFSPNSTLSLPSGSGGVSVNYNETVGALSGGTGAVPVAIATPATLTSNGQGYTSDFVGSISGGGKLVITGGVQGLAGNNSYSGGTLVTGEGELYLGSGTAVGTGTLTFDDETEFAPDANVTLSNAIVLNGTNYVDNEDGSGNLTLLGVVSGTNGFSWCTNNTFSLSGNNTFQGGIDMREGTLLLGNDNAAGTGTIILDSSTTLAAAGGPGVVRSIANPISVSGSSATFGVNDGNTLTLTGGITGNSEATLTFNGGSGGNLIITQPTSADYEFVVSSGTVTAGNNTALGPAGNSVLLTGGAALNVRTGVTLSNPLVLSGSANTLSGSGTIASSVVDDSTAVISPSASPGNGPGTLTFSGGLTLASGGAISFHLYDANGSAGTGYSLISATNGLSLTASPGTITFNLVSIDSGGNAANAVNFNAATPYSWMFATSTSAISGFDPTDFTLNTSGFLNNGNGGTFSFSETGNNLYLNFTPVPEPSTWVLIGLGGLALVPFLVRRRSAASVA